MEYRFSIMKKDPNYHVLKTQGIAEVPAAQKKLKELVEAFPPGEYDIFLEISAHVIEHAQVDVKNPEKQIIELGNKLLSRISDG